MLVNPAVLQLPVLWGDLLGGKMVGEIMVKIKKGKVLNLKLPFNWCWALTHPWDVVGHYRREIRCFIQRGIYGYSSMDLWSFDWYLRKVLAGGLREFGKGGMSYPGVRGASTPEQWQKILLEIANAFQAVNDFEESNDWSKEEMEKVYADEDKALKLLAKWFGHLWD